MSVCRNIIVFVIIAALVIGALLFFLVWNPRHNSHKAQSNGNGNSTGNSTTSAHKGYSSIHSMNWCGPRKVVALTFDDGPNVLNTPNVLADLERLNIKATFFMSPAVEGEPTAEQCAMVAKVLAAGHVVQSHSYDHKDFADKDGADIEANLQKNSDWIYTCSGDFKLNVTQFRPPYGSMDPARAGFISGLGYNLASWSIDTQDTIGGTHADRIMRTVEKEFKKVPEGGSAIILMHDRMYNDKGSAGSIDLIADMFHSMDYQFVDMNECRAGCKDDVCQTPYTIWPGSFATVF